jgi:hypothetical protein
MLVAAANPYSGRKLAGQITAAGLNVVDFGSQALIHDHASFSWPFVRMLADVAVKAGRITGDERDTFVDALHVGSELRSLHMSVTMYAVIATRTS